MDIQLDDGRSPLPNMLQQITFEDNTYKKMMAVDVVCSSLDNKISKKVDAIDFKRWLNDNYLKDKAFIRKLKLISKLEAYPETAIELSSIDFVTHPEFHYNEEFQDRIAELNKKLNHFLGKCIKELSVGSSIEFQS